MWAVIEQWDVGGQAHYWMVTKSSETEAETLAKELKIERPERIVAVAQIVSEAVQSTDIVPFALHRK